MRISAPLFTASLGISLFVGAAAPYAFTQGQPAKPTVYVVTFMKVDPDKVEEYLQLEREIWKPVHQERISSGRMRSWTLYRVRFPYGSTNEYNFATVNGYASIEDDDRSLRDTFAKVHPSIAISDLNERTFNARNLVRGEVWQRLEHIE